ncbi:hypothetical protein [Chryseobacterium polytrichastri]|uniref:Uncharacterized protein n=1 Tax=Chryseobacterium polytrichastri TaxID=1302687 RepID=A0A1M6R0W7_9FLAO|nr:hypothetical protein [Chryseobacterium polytrichastri]SHK26026.1 hypothetical protein SAMN05444267_1002149 [Chryseobacterium polytrichastri]
MRKKIFKYRLVYYLAIITSLIFFIISVFSIFGLFKDFNILSLIFICCSITINSFAFVNLVEKYDKAVLFLNLGLFLFIFSSGYHVLFGFLSKGFYAILYYNQFKFLMLFIIVLIIVNKFKIKKENFENEIEEIGKHE